MTESTPQVTIHFQGPPDGDLISDVQQLADLIRTNKGIELEANGEDAPEGAKPILTSTLAVVGAVTGVAGLVLQAVSIWKQNKPKYSITISEGGRTHTVDNLSRGDYLSILRRLNSAPPNTEIQVKIEKSHT